MAAAWKPKPFKYRPPFIPRQGYMRVNRPKEQQSDEQLTGLVQGIQASDIEERFARALDKNGRVREYDFRRTFIMPRNLAGSVEVDFMVDAGDRTPVHIDGTFSHKTAEQRGHDAVQDARLDEHLRATGEATQPSVRIPGDKLADQDMADAVVMELF